MGNGDTVTCDTGTAWNPRLVRDEPSPDCDYQYRHEGEYQVTATSHWQVERSGVGATGTIPLELSDTANFRIAEVQVVNVAGANG